MKYLKRISFVPFLFYFIKKIKIFLIKQLDFFCFPFQYYYGKLFYSNSDNISLIDAKNIINKLRINKNFFNRKIINPEIDTELLLTIIVPVFNMEKYIKLCLDSIISQKTEYRFNIIIVNDGSNDESEKIINKYISRYGNIILITQQNAGQSNARNNALEKATGKYVMFVDADDILIDNAIQNLVCIAEKNKCDIVEGLTIRFYNEVPIIHKNTNYTKVKVIIYNYLDKPNYVLQSVGYSPSRIYLRELWKKVRFPEGYIFEDIVTKFILLRFCNKFAKIDSPVYAYRFNFSSSTREKNNLRILDCVWVLPRVLEMCNQLEIKHDEISYMLTLNHVGILNWFCTKNFDSLVKKSTLILGRENLIKLQSFRPKNIPLLFKLLESTILDKNYYNWLVTAKFISKYNLISKWREIN